MPDDRSLLESLDPGFRDNRVLGFRAKRSATQECGIKGGPRDPFFWLEDQWKTANLNRKKRKIEFRIILKSLFLLLNSTHFFLIFSEFHEPLRRFSAARPCGI